MKFPTGLDLPRFALVPLSRGSKLDLLHNRQSKINDVFFSLEISSKVSMRYFPTANRSATAPSLPFAKKNGFLKTVNNQPSAS